MRECSQGISATAVRSRGRPCANRHRAFAPMKAGTEWIVTFEGFLANREKPGSPNAGTDSGGARVILLETENPDQVRVRSERH